MDTKELSPERGASSSCLSTRDEDVVMSSQQSPDAFTKDAGRAQVSASRTRPGSLAEPSSTRSPCAAVESIAARSQTTRSASSGRSFLRNPRSPDAERTSFEPASVPIATPARNARSTSVTSMREMPRRDLSPRPQSPGRQSPRASAVPVSSCEQQRMMPGNDRESSLPRGPERLFYDTRGYTGCARFGIVDSTAPARRSCKLGPATDALLSGSPFPQPRRKSIR